MAREVCMGMHGVGRVPGPAVQINVVGASRVRSSRAPVVTTTYMKVNANLPSPGPSDACDGGDANLPEVAAEDNINI